MNELFAAKSNEDGLWECVPQHLKDTAEVMRCLCDETSGWVSPAFFKATQFDSYDQFLKICIFLAAVHDLGKLTPVFQHRIAYSLPGLSDRLLRKGYNIEKISHQANATPHAVISAVILQERYNIDESVCEVIAAHHGTPRGYSDEYSSLLKHHKEDTSGIHNEWHEVWDEAVKEAEFISGLKCEDIPEISPASQILLSGLLITADWIASNENFFPLEDRWGISHLNDPNRGRIGFEASGVKRGWFPQTYGFNNLIFQDHFGFEANELQIASASVANRAKLIIVEGPMGVGKTEAALMCAEIMASQNASGGFYIGLPTQATSNVLFHRIYSWAGNMTFGLDASISLAHGGAQFQDEYKSLLVNTSEEMGLTINEWMNARHRKLMADFVDGTIDQAISMSLDRKYFMLLHEQLAGKVVVFDEIHSYDAYTSAYIETTLSYFGSYGCPVILLSATLTNEKKNAYIRAYAQNKKICYNESAAYPCVTWWDGESVHSDPVPAAGIRHHKIAIHWIEEKKIAETLKELLPNGGCAGIIRNTVSAAVQTYRELRKALPEANIILIHSRFLMEDRTELENRIVSLTGKNSGRCERDGLIVVGTQVLEQSLDIDFDVMLTDLCPMDLLLQRLGREHRHVQHDVFRPDTLKSPAVYLITRDEKAVGSNGKPYNSYIINRTVAQLRSLARDLILPDDIKSLVEQTYDMSSSPEEPEKREYVDLITKLKNNSARNRIPDVWNLMSLSDIQGVTLERSGADENSGVRQGDSSMTVLVLKAKDGRISDVGESASCKIGWLPDEETRNTFLRQEIHIPAYMISGEELKKMKIRTGFGDEGVWAYKDILLLDENCTYVHSVNGIKKCYIYDRETGLTEVKNE